MPAVRGHAYNCQAGNRYRASVEKPENSMKHSFLSTLFNALTDKEIDSLEQFVRSPYFNRGANQDKLPALFYILKQDPGNPPEKEEIFKLLYPDTPWVPGKVDKLMSEFASLLRQFLLIEHRMEDGNSFGNQLEWAVILRKRGLSGRYSTVINKAEQMLEESPVESLEHYYHQFQLAYEKYDLQSQSNHLKNDLNLVETITRLDIYYLARRVELLNFLLLQRKMVRIEVPERLLIEHTGFVPIDDLDNNALLSLSLKINEQLVSDRPSADNIHEIFTRLQENEHRIDPVTRQNFYAYLRNLCTLLIQMGDTSFLETLHNIQRDNLSKGYLFVDGKLTPSAYLSIVRTAVRIGRQEWALGFIEDYKDYLFNEAAKNDYYFLTKAECLFSMERYEEALDVLPANFADVLYLTHCRRLELKIYYELQSDLLPYKLDAYKMFISRASKKKLSDVLREFESNFANLLLQIVQCPPQDPARKEKIAARIKEKKSVADREWLLEKIAARR